MYMTRKFGGFKVSDDQLAVAEKQTPERKKEKKEVKFFLPGVARSRNLIARRKGCSEV